MNRPLLPRWIFTALIALVLVLAGPVHADTTVFIVRHAEKASGSDLDPLLSPDGRERARLLRDMLRSVELTAIYSTKYHRTIDTVAPTAEAHELDVSVRDADMDLLAGEIFAEVDAAVLVAGHSNTVPALLLALGVEGEFDIVDTEYDNLFVVTITGEGVVTLLHLHYGY